MEHNNFCNNLQIIRVYKSKVDLVKQNFDKIHNLFAVRLIEIYDNDEQSVGSSTSDAYVSFAIESENFVDANVILKVQKFIENGIGCSSEEDSSYDSDFDDCGATGGGSGVISGTELEEHREISRTSSDTLAQEYAEYVTQPGYQARVEFALKLGYTEALVQAALAKLGPHPHQNELLAELIKLGAHSSNNDLSTSDWVEDNLDDSPTLEYHDDTNLRPIVIDGSNIAMSHGNKEVFSCRGIKICVEWFRYRGHREITVFVPKWRKESARPDNPIIDQEILYELEKERLLVFTPSRLIAGKRLVCYDDRYILRLASETGGIVVSNDNYRDLAQENPEFRKVVEERILMYSFVNDRFMPPEDPLGRSGPTLDKFLQMSWKTVPTPPCPYGRKCTYGTKCKFQHPERGSQPHKSITERLHEHAQRQLQARRETSPGKQLKGKSLSLPLQNSENFNDVKLGAVRKMPLTRTKSNIVTSSDNDPFIKLNYHHPTSAPPPQQIHENNLHKKLQRQLSLNPLLGDPRIYQNNVHRPKHKPVTRHMSYEITTGPSSYSHSQVSRIASAPPGPVPHWQTSPEQERLRIHYHLASIFPEDQVRSAMNLYPNETNPQKICAAILSLYSNKN